MSAFDAQDALTWRNLPSVYVKIVMGQGRGERGCFRRECSRTPLLKLSHVERAPRLHFALGPCVLLALRIWEMD